MQTPMPMVADTIAASHSLPGWLKNTLLASGTFIVCWVVAIVYWRMGTRSPTIGEIGLCLVGLPILTLSAWFLGRKMIAQGVAPPTVALSSAPARPATLPAHAAALAIVATALRTPHGASPAELAAAVAANKARPDLDRELLDDEGFPIMTARCREARNGALQENITDWLTHSGLADVAFTEAQWRALILGTEVCAELASHAATNLMSPEGQAPALQVLPVLPSDWSVAQRHAADMWLRHTVVQSGWPSDRIVSPIHDQPGAAVISPVALFDTLACAAATPDVQLAAVIVACASHLDDSTVARWSADKILFTASHPHGAIPGEGAAGLLLADVTQAHLQQGALCAVLEPLVQARRATSADETRHIDPARLAEVIDSATRTAHIDAKDIAMIVVDAGHRTNRMLELMDHVSPIMPQLDGVEDLVRVGPACGSCGMVPFFTALTMSHHYASKRQAAVLCVGNEDLYQRIAAVIRPSFPLL